MRVRGLRFIPSTINFSDMSPRQESSMYDETEEDKKHSEIDKEYLLLNILSGLGSDKERCIFLLEILREYGYKLDYGSQASALKIKLRWFMRVKKNVWQKVREITTN